MRDVSRLRWLQGRLWTLTFAALGFILYGMLPWRSAPDLSFRYVWLSHAGVLTTGKVESYEGWVGPLTVYSFAAPDGVRHQGQERRAHAAGEELLVYYLLDNPEVNTPHNLWFELEQWVVAVLLIASCATSLLVRFRRRPA